MAARLPLVALLLFLLAPSASQCLRENPRSRREVHKRAKPPGGEDGGRPITVLQGFDSPGNNSALSVSGNSSHKQRPHMVDVGNLLQAVLSSQANNSSDRAGGSSSKQKQQQLRSRHINASMAELVAVQTLQGEVSWIEAKFVNDSHGTGPRRHRRRTRPYSFEERLALIVPVFFALPFLVWLTCMVTCLARASAKSSY